MGPSHPEGPPPIPSASPLQLFWQQGPGSGWAQEALGQARGWQWAWPSRHWHSWQGSRGWEKLSPSINTCFSRMQSGQWGGWAGVGTKTDSARSRLTVPLPLSPEPLHKCHLEAVPMEGEEEEEGLCMRTRISL